MRAALLSVVLAFLMGFAPVVASCCENHATNRKAHGETECKHCHSDKTKSEKKADACNGEKRCVGESSEKQSKLRHAPIDNFSGVTDEQIKVGFPVVAFLDPQERLLKRAASSVPIYLLKKSLRP